MRYLQITNDYITDSIEYAFGDYIQFMDEVPIDIMNGCYKLENNAIVLDTVKHEAFLIDQERLLNDL